MLFLTWLKSSMCTSGFRPYLDDFNCLYPEDCGLSGVLMLGFTSCGLLRKSALYLNGLPIWLPTPWGGWLSLVLSYMMLDVRPPSSGIWLMPPVLPVSGSPKRSLSRTSFLRLSGLKYCMPLFVGGFFLDVLDIDRCWMVFIYSTGFSMIYSLVSEFKLKLILFICCCRSVVLLSPDLRLRLRRFRSLYSEYRFCYYWSLYTWLWEWSLISLLIDSMCGRLLDDAIDDMGIWLPWPHLFQFSSLWIFDWMASIRLILDPM